MLPRSFAAWTLALGLLMPCVDAGEPAPPTIDRLITQLGSDDFAERQAAERALELIGEPALPALRRAAAANTALEARRRAGTLAGKIGAIVDAVAAVRALGGSVVIDAKRPGRPVVGIALSGPKVTDAAVKRLANFPALESLRLHKTAVTGNCLPVLAALTGLRTLDLSGSGEIHSVLRPSPFDQQVVVVPFLKELASLKRLEDLDLTQTLTRNSDLADLGHRPGLRRLTLKSTQVADAGFDHFKALPGLRHLSLAYTGTHDAGLPRLLVLKQLESLDLDLTHVTDAGLETLAKLPALRTLNLSHCQKITDAGLVRIKELPLVELRLDYAGITNAGLAHLAGMTQLRVLTLDSTPVQADGVAHLAGLVELRTLVIGHGVTDRGLAHLTRLTRLQTLTGLTHVTDAGLAPLRGMHDLRVLDFYGARITDAGLSQLTGLTKLRVLGLRDTAVTDAGLAQLKALTELKELDLFGTKTTAASKDRLRKALPELTIDRPRP